MEVAIVGSKVVIKTVVPSRNGLPRRLEILGREIESCRGIPRMAVAFKRKKCWCSRYGDRHCNYPR
jgi:hypothetical protein